MGSVVRLGEGVKVVVEAKHDVAVAGWERVHEWS